MIEHPVSFYVTSCNETVNHGSFTCEKKEPAKILNAQDAQQAFKLIN